MKRISGSIIPIIAIVVLLFGLAVILPTEVEAAFDESQAAPAVVVAPDFMIGIGSDPPITGSDQNLLADFDSASIAVIPTQTDFGNGVGIDPGGGTLPLSLIDGVSVLTTSYNDETVLRLATDLNFAKTLDGMAVGAGIFEDTPGIDTALKIDENVPSSAMTATTYAPTTSVTTSEMGVFPVSTMGFVAGALAITTGFGLLLAASRRYATFAPIVGGPFDTFGRNGGFAKSARRLQALGA